MNEVIERDCLSCEDDICASCPIGAEWFNSTEREVLEKKKLLAEKQCIDTQKSFVI